MPVSVPGRSLAVIPARGGSKGLPGKNLKLFAGLPLIAHSILFAKQCDAITRTIVSTDDDMIARVAAEYRAEVLPRPSELAQDDTPVWPVVQHALNTLEARDVPTFDWVILLDPTSPGRDFSDVAGALERLHATPSADGVVGVSTPHFNPLWNCVVERDGFMADAFEQGNRIVRRQDAPAVYRIHGSLYIWRASFVRSGTSSWREEGRHVMYDTPEVRSMSIDTVDEFEQAEALVKGGLITLPWLDHAKVSP